MDNYPTTPMPITRLIVLEGSGEFDLSFNPQNTMVSEVNYLLRPVPEEFVVVEDHSNGKIKFSHPQEVEIEGRTYKMGIRSENPTLLVFHTDEPVAEENKLLVMLQLLLKTPQLKQVWLKRRRMCRLTLLLNSLLRPCVWLQRAV